MKAAILLAALLASCQGPTWGGAADWITPDELTVGQGSSEYAWSGGHLGSDPAYSYDGENESTYAALTWHLPTWEGRDGGMSRETQRNMALLIDRMVEEEGLDTGPGASLVSQPGAPSPPPWMPYALGGIVAVFALVMIVQSKRSNGW